MEFKISRNFRAIRFIRCETPILGSHCTAAGAALSLPLAIARCESELIERQFELHELRAVGVIPLGIAAHPNLEKAKERAQQETIETLCLDQIRSEMKIRCIFKLVFHSFALGLTKTSHGYFCFIRGFLGDDPIAAYSAAPWLFSSIFKTWEEYQSIHFFRPQGTNLKNYTKAHKIFIAGELKSLPLQIEPQFVYKPDFSGLTVASAERSGRVIVYYVNKKENES